MNLAVERGWYRPYENPDQRLAESYRQSETVICSERQLKP